MKDQVPESMLALAIYRFSNPKDYDLATIPTPKISKPDEVLIKVHSASINPGELKLASGGARLVKKDVKFPWTLGYDVSGTVVAVGSSVTSLNAGDEVYSKVPEDYKGTVAQYALSLETSTAKVPKSVGLSKSSSVPLAGATALLSLERGNGLLVGGLRGKTVLIPGGLSGTGHFAVQLAKNVFGATKVITTLSTSKVSKFKELLGEGYQVVDYTNENLLDVVPKGSVDFMFDTMGQSLKALPLIKKGGVIVTISSVTPSGTELTRAGFDPPFLLVHVLNIFDWMIRSWAGSSGVNYSCFFPKSSSKELIKMAELIDAGKVVPIVGLTANLSDIEGVRNGCQRVFDGKGGVGKFVIEID